RGLSAAKGPAATPVAIAGGPLMRTDSWLFDTIERAGGTVVLDATETGSRTLPAPFDRRKLGREPLEELVRAYFGGIPDAFRRPDEMLFEWLGVELRASGARGVILRRYAWCDMWAPAHERLKGLVDLPVLCLDSAGEAGPPGSEANRVEAFMEMLR
ncbi:MAG: 2-hydroxyacyl-CoA dehydratase, partial [Planctomycetota bacterium]